VINTVPAVTPTPITIPLSRATVASDWPLPPAPNTFTSLNQYQVSRTEWTNLRFSQFIESPEKEASLMWGVAKGDGENTANNRRNNTSARSLGDDVTYTAGGTYKIFAGNRDSAVNSAILFANTSTSFIIQGGNQQNPNQFNNFTTVAALQAYINSLAPNPVSPQTGKGWEAGMRFELLDRRLKWSVAYFDQTRENIARNFFVRQTLVPGETNELALATYQLAAGAEQGKGIDTELSWQVTKEVSLLAGAMLMNGKVIANPESPEEVGFGLVSSPETRLSLWALYRAAAGSTLAGFSGGIGASYNSSSRIRPEVGDRFRVSDTYTLGRAMLRYRIPGKNYAHEVSLNVDNLLDQEYTDEGNWLSEPRTFKAAYTISW
jgi:outer membrane receptor for ferric coprogen and ferric-rhodotorulic acid